MPNIDSGPSEGILCITYWVSGGLFTSRVIKIDYEIINVGVRGIFGIGC